MILTIKVIVIKTIIITMIIKYRGIYIHTFINICTYVYMYICIYMCEKNNSKIFEKKC